MTALIIDPQSISEILRASTILLIQLNNITLGQWLKEEAGDLMVRDVSMQVTIEKVLKGNVHQRPGEPFELTIQEKGTGGFRVMDYYGLWSQVSLVDGVRLLAFCIGSTEDAAVLLTDDNCEQLVDASITLDDTEAALELETEDLSTAEILARAGRLIDQRDDIFARYVFAKIKPEVMLAIDTASALTLPFETPFEELMKILENSKTKERAKESYLTSIYEELSLMESPPRRLELRFIQTLFELLILAESKSIQAAVGELYLPNLLRPEYDPPRYSVTEVFDGRTDKRLKCLSNLKSETAKDSRQTLIKWLERNTN